MSWDFSKKQEFVQWLHNKVETRHITDHRLFPTPLIKKLFGPVYDEWIEREPNNAEAHARKAVCISDFELYRKAIEIDPDNQRARVPLSWNCVSYIQFSTHHLPEFFIGDEEKVLKRAAEAEEHLAHIKEGPLKDIIISGLRSEEQLLRDWVQFKLEEGNNFDQWCKDKGRQYHWVMTTYFDK